MRQSMGTPKIWTLLGFCACLLCDPVISAAIPIATEGPGTPEYDYVDDDSFPWGTEEDYLDPTTLATTTERPLESQIIPQLASVPLGSEFPGETSELPGENPGSAAEVSTSSPVKKETLNSVQASDEDKVDSATEASRQPEIKPQEESLEETTKIPVEVEKELSDANSSQSSLEKGPVKVSSEASVESATTAILSSKETLVSIGEQPEESVLVSDTYPRVTGPIPAAGSGEETGASTSGEELDNVVTVLPPLGAEREKSFDTTTREIDTDDGLNPADASWDDTTDTIPEPNEETPELSPDGSKEASPNLEDPSSNTDELSPEEASTTSLDGSVPAPPPENSVITEETSSSESGPSALGTLPGLSESNELTAGSARPTAEVDLGAELDGTEGRGDTDGPVAASSDTETEDVPASPRPETSLESTGEVSAREPEGVADAETSNSPEDEPAGARSDVTSPSDAGSRPSDLGYNTASGIPVELPTAPVSFPLSEDDAAGAVAATTGHTEVTEVSGNPYSSEEGPMAEQGAADEGAKVPEGENISSRLDSATSSALNSAVEAAAPLDPAENDPLASGTQSEIQPSSNLEALTDTETSSSSALEAETVADARAASAEETSSLASPADALSDPSEEIAPNGAPGNDGWSSEDGEMASQSAEKGVEPTARSDGPRGTGLQAPDTGSGLPGALLDGNPPNQRPVEDSAIASPDIYSRGESSLPPKSPDDSLSSASDSDTTAAPLNGSPLEDSMTSVSDISSSGSLTLPLGSPGDTLSDTPDSDTTKALSNESPLDDSATDTWTSVESGLASESPSDTLSGPSDPDSDPVNKPPNGSLVEGSAASAADVSSSGEAALSSAPRKKPPSEALDSAAAGPPRNGPLLDDSVTSAPGTSSREDSALPSESVNDELSEASNPDVDRTDIPANGSPLDGSVPKASSSTFPSTSPNDALSSPSGSNSDTADAAPPGLSLEGSVPSAADTSSSENSVFPSKSPGDALSDASDSDTTEARLNGSPSKGSVPSAAEASSSENSVFPSKSPGDALSDASDSDTTEARLNGSPSKGSVPSAAEASSSENSVFPSKSPGDALSDASDSDTTEARLNGSPSKGSVPSAAEASSSEDSTHPSQSPNDALSDASDSDFDATQVSSNGTAPAGMAADTSSSERSALPSKSPADMLSDASGTDKTEGALNGLPLEGSLTSASVSQEETVTAWGNSPVTVGSSFRVDDGSLGSERAKEPSIANSAATSGGESGALGDTDTSSPFVVGSEASATSGERPSLSSLSQAPSGSLDLENEGGESALRPTAGNLAPSTQDSEVADGSRVGEGGTGTGGSESQRGTEASSSERELGPAEGTEPLVGKSGALAIGEPPKKSSVQDGEVTASKEGSLSAPASPGEKSPLPPLLPGAEPSPNPGFPGAFATNDALPAESEAPELEEDPSVGREKEPPLASLATESQTAAYLGEGAGESQISSDPSETATSLHPLAAASQLPGSPEGEKTAATATHPGSVSSTEAGQSPENISEQLEQKSGLIEGGQSSSSSVDDDSVATIHKASGGTLPPSASTSSLGSLAAGAASNQKLGIMDSSQLASGSDGVGSPGLASSGEPTFSDGVKLSWSDSFSPVARAGAEVPNGVPGSGTAALGRGGGPAAAASPVASSPKSAPEHPSAKAGPPIGKVTGKMSASPSASETQGTGPSSNGASRSSSEPGAGSLHSSAPLPAEGRGDTGSFVSTISKGSPAARLQPGQKASPAKPAGKLGPDAETETSPQLSQTKPVLPPVLESQDLGTSQILGLFHPAIPLHIHPTRQLPTLQNRYPPQTIPSDEASSSSSSSDSVPSSPGNKPVSGVIRSGNTVASSSNKTDAHRAVGKVSSVAAKPSPTTRKPSGRKAELRPNARSGKMTAAKEKPVKSSQVPEASVPASAAKSSEERADSRESGEQEEQVPKANSRRSQTRGRARRSRRGQ